VIFALGPPLPHGALVLDLGCGDASFADEVLARGYRYVGVDASAGMCAAAGARLAGRGVVEQGDFESYATSVRPDAVLVLRALYLSDARVEVLRRLRALGPTKVVFDMDPRRVPLATIRAEVDAAGFDHLTIRPFFLPARVVPSPPVDLALRALERTGPLARLLLRFRFRVMCCAYGIAAWFSTNAVTVSLLESEFAAA
jgi:SAM-dependent methyltransferase